MSSSFRDAIGLLSLIASLALFTIAALTVRYETTYDKHIDNHENIFRVERLYSNKRSSFTFFQPTFNFPITDPKLETHISAKFGDNRISILSFRNRAQIKLLESSNSKNIVARALSFKVSENAAEFLELEMIAGLASTSLSEPNSILISEAVAQEYFKSDKYSIGDKVYTQSGEIYTLGGIFKNLPHNTHFGFEALVSRNKNNEGGIRPAERQTQEKSIKAIDTITYVKLNEVSSKNFTNFLKSLDEQLGEPFKRLSIVPISKIHLNSRGVLGRSNGNKVFVFAMATVAIIAYLLSIANFFIFQKVSLQKQVRKLSIMKVSGWSPQDILLQYASRFLLLVILTSLGVVFCSMAFFAFAKTSLPSNINLLQLFNSKNILTLFTLLIFALIVSIPPSTFTVAFSSPAKLMGYARKQFTFANLGMKTVIAIQFLISSAMMMSFLHTNYIIDQLKNRDRGFSYSEVYNLDNIFDINAQTFSTNYSRELNSISNLAKDSGIIEDFVLTSSSLPGHVGNLAKVKLLAEENASVEINQLSVSRDFFEFYKVKVIAGRGFDRNLVSDSYDSSSKGIENQTIPIVITLHASQLLGFVSAEQSIGASILAFEGTAGKFDFLSNRLMGVNAVIVGVVDDTYFGGPEVSSAIFFHSDVSKFRNVSLTTFRPELLKSNLTNIISQVLGKSDFRITNFKDRLKTLELRQRSRLSAFLMLSCLISFAATYFLYTILIHGGRKDVIIRRTHGYCTLDIIKYLSPKILPPVFLGSILGASATLLFAEVFKVGYSWVPLSKSVYYGIFICIIFTSISAFFIGLIEPNVSKRNFIEALNDNSLTT